MLSPSAPAYMADQADAAPCRMITLGGERDVLCFRGRIFLVRRDEASVGVTIVAGRLFVVRDTAGYRQWPKFGRICAPAASRAACCAVPALEPAN